MPEQRKRIPGAPHGTGPGLRTRLVHALGDPDPRTGAIMPPLELATTFARGEDGSLPGPYIYGRQGNPARARLEAALAALEGGAEALAFASGSAAALSVLLGLGAGSSLAVDAEAYYGVRRLLTGLGPSLGLAIRSFDPRSEEDLARVLADRPGLVWLETPSHPLLRVTDLAAVIPRAHAAGALVLADNTLATPLGQSPLALGADLVLHATTKAIAGHSDASGGGLVVRDAASPLWARIRRIQVDGGAVPSPFDCYLVLRGLSTLAVRLAAMEESALRLAARLALHPAVHAVHHPSRPEHPDFEVARRQSGGGPALLAIQVRGGEAAAARVLGRVRLWTRATSFGGVHSLIEHRRLVEGEGSAVPADLLRLAVGLEDPEDLEEDLLQALEGWDSTA
jgi:cystathionine gamma-synthase